MDNRAIAERLRQHARELDRTRGNLLRVRAYRRAAHSILEQDTPLEEIFVRGGRRALRIIPDIGAHIAKTVENIIRSDDRPRSSQHRNS